jgi:hypothetical protein
MWYTNIENLSYAMVQRTDFKTALLCTHYHANVVLAKNQISVESNYHTVMNWNFHIC